MSINVNLPNLIGKGYGEFWRSKKRYRIVKGGRGSKKSVTASFWFPSKMMEYYHKYNLKPNTLVLRRYMNTHRNSTWAQLAWAINKLQVPHLWKINKSDLTITYKPSGQQILFRGIDEPQSITSITASEGHLCWVWWEEAFQIMNENDFNMVDLSIRGDIPEPLFKQHTFTLNPWSDKHWIKRRFFDIPDDDTFTSTTTYLQNEFLGTDDIKVFEKMKEINPRRYEIEGLGNWGIAEGLIYTNWKVWDESEPTLEQLLKNGAYRKLNGLDFGYNNPTAFIACLNKIGEFKIYVYDEWYMREMENREIYKAIVDKGFEHEHIEADSEDPRTINELKILGLSGIKATKKGPVLGGIQTLQDYQIIVHPRCQNTIVELSNYVWETDKQTGVIVNKPAKDFDHLMDALRYATVKLNRYGIKFA